MERLRSEELPQSTMGAFAEQMQIEVPDGTGDRGHRLSG
jgi:hypothetical protein